MATMRRPAAMRALARDLEEQFGTRFEAEHDSGATWRLYWSLGPLRKTVGDLVAQAADRLGGAEVEIWRNDGGDRELALAVIRVAAAGELEPGKRWGGPFSAHNQAEHYLRETAYPERATDREEAMAARLMHAAAKPLPNGSGTRLDAYAMCTLVDQRGIGWLLAPELPSDQEGQSEADGFAASPVERLTARYAEGEAERAWQRTGRTLPLRTAVDAALADPDLPDSELLAVLALTKELQAELDAITEKTALRLSEGVARKAFTYDQIGEVLGVKKQSAQAWVTRRGNHAQQRRRTR